MRRVSRRLRERALTLIEVMVALGVLVILVGGIFLVVRASLQTVLMVDNAASRADEITNLVDVLRSGLRNLPPQTRMVAREIEDGKTKEYLFIFRNAPGFLTWLAEPEAEDTIVLLAMRQDAADDGWRVCLKRFAPPESLPRKNFDPENILRYAAKVPWLELVSDFKKVNLRFYDAKTEQWKDRWDNPDARPGLIELHLVSELVKDPRSETPVFWIPPVKVEKDET